VIANVPNNVVGPALTPSRQWNPWSPAWTYKGAPLTPGMRIPVGKIKGRLFLDAAGVDREWNAIGTHLLDQIQELRPQPNRDFIRRDRKAGHGVGALVPYLPFVDPRSEAKRLRGVNVFANKIDDAWLWPQLLTFLRG
jgi:hypothetical protein